MKPSGEEKRPQRRATDQVKRPSELIAKEQVFAGGGEMGAVMRGLDWSQTALGPVETWSLALRMMARFLLANRFPLLLWWGPDFCQLYNDAYRPVLGAKHPHFVGRPVSECWNEIWHILEPLIRTPFEGSPPTWMEDIPLEINRYGFVEETHFTIAYSPVPDETAPGGIGGVLATVHEISEKVVGERRTRLLRDLGAVDTAETAEEACVRAAGILAGYPQDIPFALLYLIEPDGSAARLSGAAGVNVEESGSPGRITLNGTLHDAVWPLLDVIKTENPQMVEELGTRFTKIPSGPWADPPNCAAVVPVKSNVVHHLAGFLVAGISPRLRLDDSYRGFLELVSSQIATAIANARAYEEERKRAEALAEIDRAKTTFFTNISHEFRTPLTLLLSPLEEALVSSKANMGDREREQLAVAHRNGMRLLKLVNTLLDFSRIEAGRIRANYEPTDLARLTGELASMFQSATEKAGLTLRIECSPLEEPIYVDRDMWEKILLNLLSNAFKFTLVGGIDVSLEDKGSFVELAVSDSGTGIPESELPRLFERFHRVEGATGRTFEGSGIGLALVQELVKIHGGKVSVESILGQGSTFRITIPKGKAHLPQDRIQATSNAISTTLQADTYLAEAMRWIPESRQEAEPVVLPEINPTLDAQSAALSTAGVEGAHIVLADDNADMRDYVRRLLGRRYRVTAVSNGQEALEVIQQSGPDLVLTDVMMPLLDGFGLLKAVRSNPSISTIPIIMLSARAGEESRVEGLQAGANDYLVKPFTARELLARVGSHLTIARLRKELLESERELRQKAESSHAALQDSEQRFRTIVTATSDVVYRMSPDWTEMRQLQGKDFIADTGDPSRTWLDEYIHPDDQLRVVEAINAAIRNKSIFELEHRVRRRDNTTGWTLSRAIPILNDKHEIVEWLGAASDITERKRSEERLRQSAKQLFLITDTAPVYIAHCDSEARFKFVNRAYAERFGLSPVECIGKKISDVVGEEAYQSFRPYVERALEGDFVEFESEVPYLKIGKHFMHCSYAPEFDATGNVAGFVAAITDITARKQMEDALRKSEKLAAVGRLAATIAHEINNPLEAVTNIIWLLQQDPSLPPSAREYLKTADEELARVAHLTKQTLDFYRGSAEPQRLNVGELLEGVLGIFGPRLRNKTITVRKEIDPASEVTGVNSELRQILANLISNSIDAVALGGTIRVRVSPARRKDVKGVKITIADNGVGIPESHRKKIFEPFFSTKSNVGTGLGLWIISEAIKKHDGSIRLKTSTIPGHSWTAFSIFLPEGSATQATPISPEQAIKVAS